MTRDVCGGIPAPFSILSAEKAAPSGFKNTGRSGTIEREMRAGGRATVPPAFRNTAVPPGDMPLPGADYGRRPRKAADPGAEPGAGCIKGAFYL